ncbi:MAG: hypothetical protein AAGK37_00305 [Pseudomonadota bacterium]
MAVFYWPAVQRNGGDRMQGDDTRDRPAEAAQDILRQAQLHYADAIDLFQDALARVKRGEDVPGNEVEKTARAYFAAIQTLLSIRLKLEDEERRNGTDDGAIDLDAARDTVGGLLDRLRDQEETD